jgi:hypothetical protein
LSLGNLFVVVVAVVVAVVAAGVAILAACCCREWFYCCKPMLVFGVVPCWLLLLLFVEWKKEFRGLLSVELASSLPLSHTSWSRARESNRERCLLPSCRTLDA